MILPMFRWLKWHKLCQLSESYHFTLSRITPVWIPPGSSHVLVQELVEIVFTQHQLKMCYYSHWYLLDSHFFPHQAVFQPLRLWLATTFHKQFTSWTIIIIKKSFTLPWQLQQKSLKWEALEMMYFPHLGNGALLQFIKISWMPWVYDPLLGP